MSRDIFQLSQTYMDDLRKSSYNDFAQINLRRSIILGFLDESYSLGKGVSISQVMDALAAQNVQVTVSAVRRDITMYRLIYRYFHDGNVDLRNKNNAQRLKPLLGLLQDGFDSWEKIVDMTNLSAHEQDVELCLSTSPAFATKAEQMSRGVVNAVDVLQKTATLFVEYHNELNRRERELEEITKRNVEQEAYIAELRGIIDAHAQEMTDLKRQYDDMQGAQRMLTEVNFMQKQTIDQLKKKIENMQTAFRLMQEVFVEGHPKDPFHKQHASDANTVSVDEEFYMDAESIVRLQLPQLCLFCNKAFRYSSKFENEFQTLSRKNQDAVVSSIMTLSEHGPEYMGLRTNKVQVDYHNGRIKGGMMKCRVGRSFRLVWEILDDALHVVGIFHKNKIGG